jgi:hypothetical protein
LSSPQFFTVHVALLNEGTDVWRPVEAIAVDGGYQLIAPHDYDPDDEEWAFPPGSNVRCEKRTMSGGFSALVAVALI